MEDNLVQAKKVYDVFCEVLKEKGIEYEGDPKHYSFTFKYTQNNVTFDFYACADTTRNVFKIKNKLNVKFNLEQMRKCAYCICKVNQKIAYGAFYLHYYVGYLSFECNVLYRGTAFDKKVYSQLLYSTHVNALSYYEKFKKLANNEIDIDEF